MQFAQGDVQLHGHNIFTSHRNYAFICVNLKSQKKHLHSQTPQTISKSTIMSSNTLNKMYVEI